MLNIFLSEKKKQPLYEQLYEQIKKAILAGAVKTGEKLPSKRKLAAYFQISVNTVENAYAQLYAEGYIEAFEKSGYYVQQIEIIPGRQPDLPHAEANFPEEKYKYDMKTSAVDTESFPFSVWSKLMRESLRDEQESLLTHNHPQGNPELRREIALYLSSYRGMNVSAEQIILGAGTEYLLGLIIELLYGSVFAVEEPCYHKQISILKSRRAAYLSVRMDKEGMKADILEGTTASAAIITPSRHFPLTAVMSISRRMQLLKWASGKNDRYIIEDDFDSEYRYMLKQIPSVFSLDGNGKVIYLNTFTRTLSPSLRIAYMALPKNLLKEYREKLRFYSCSVSEFEQSALRRFLHGGYYERHISRMRLIYKDRRNTLMQAFAQMSGSFAVYGHEGGFHLLIKSLKGMTEKELISRAKNAGVKVYGLSGYYADAPGETYTVILGYGGYDAGVLKEIAALLIKAWQ